MLFAQAANPDAAAQELLTCRFWLDLKAEYEVVYGMEHQPEPEVLAKRRENDAERQRRKRRKDVGLPEKDD